MKEVGGTCSACHKQYREQDAEGNYKIKAGTHRRIAALGVRP